VHEQTALSFFPRFLRFGNLKVVSTIHQTGINTRNLSRADELYSISKSVQEDIKNRYNQNSILNYNGILFEPISQKNDYELNPPFKIIQISRLMHSIKGQDILIRSLAELNKLYSAELHFVGDGESKKFLLNLADELNLTNHVIFHGNLPKKQVYQMLSQFDILVQPSRYEGFGLTVVEAMAAKVPVLVSDVEGPMEVIRNGKYGFYFESENVKSCTQAIIKILEEYKTGTITEIVNEAYRYAEKMYNIKRTAQTYLEKA
jgi:glycosyltransferase involved in cell wall biosynthesis